MMRVYRSIINYIRRRTQKIHTIASIGDDVLIDPTVQFHYQQHLHIEHYCRIGQDCYINAEGGCTVGAGTIMAPEVWILSSTHRYEQSNLLPYDEVDEARPVHIGKGCWLGWGAKICPGVTIGAGAVIAAGSVVVKNVPKGAIVGGNPATIIKYRQDIDFIDSAIENAQYYIKAKKEKNLKRRIK